MIGGQLPLLSPPPSSATLAVGKKDGVCGVACKGGGRGGGGRGVDLYTFGWTLVPPILISPPPHSLYLLVGAPDTESGFWLLRAD